jgi:hypothetical protein
MRHLLALLPLVGCAADDMPPEIVVDNMAVLDIVIAPSGLAIYADSIYADPQCTTRFPNLGGLIELADVTSCEPSLFGCVERITYAGTTYLPPSTDLPLAIPSPPSATSLVIEGCGARETVVLPFVSLPDPPDVHGAIEYDATNRIVDVAWASDPRAASHLVTFAAPLSTVIRRVDRTDERFTTTSLGMLSTTVQTLLPGTQLLTTLGLVRLWPASDPTTHQLQVERDL